MGAAEEGKKKPKNRRGEEEPRVLVQVPRWNTWQQGKHATRTGSCSVRHTPPVSHTGRACVSQSDQDHEHALFPCTSHILWVSLTEGLWQPQSSKSISVIFPTASAHFMALYRLVVILTGFQAFSVLLHLLSWSVISDFTTVIGGFCILFFKSRYALFKKIMLLHT